MCSGSDRANASAWFEASTGSNKPWYLMCAGDRVVEAVHRADPDRTDKLFFDVGLNKGYFVADWMARWAPELGITPARIGAHWRGLQPDSVYCGGCGECRSNPETAAEALYRGSALTLAKLWGSVWAARNSPDPSAGISLQQSGGLRGPLGDPGDLRFVGIEANPATFEEVTLRSPLGVAGGAGRGGAGVPLPSGLFTGVHGAATDSEGDGQQRFQACAKGTGGCSAWADGNSTMVPRVTVDGVLRSLMLPAPFWLQVRAFDEGGRCTLLRVGRSVRVGIMLSCVWVRCVPA